MIANNKVNRTKVFTEWLDALDAKVQKRVVARIAAAQAGNFGDHKYLGDDVSELRLDFGPGYRVYYMRTGDVVYLLLSGGDKGTQSRDIEAAKAMARQVKETIAANAAREQQERKNK